MRVGLPIARSWGMPYCVEGVDYCVAVVLLRSSASLRLGTQHLRPQSHSSTHINHVHTTCMQALVLFITLNTVWAVLLVEMAVYHNIKAQLVVFSHHHINTVTYQQAVTATILAPVCLTFMIAVLSVSSFTGFDGPWVR